MIRFGLDHAPNGGFAPSDVPRAPPLSYEMKRTWLLIFSMIGPFFALNLALF